MSRPVERRPRTAGRHLGRRWLAAGWVLLPVAVGLQQWAPASAVERLYSRALYPWIAVLLSLANEWAGFSLAEAGALLLPPALLFALVWSAVRARRMGVRWGRWLAGTTGRGIAAAGWDCSALFVTCTLCFCSKRLSKDTFPVTSHYK